MMSEVKCTCGRRTPFAHNHAVDCPVFNPQMLGRSQRPKAVDPDDIKLVSPDNIAHLLQTWSELTQKSPVVTQKILDFEEAFQIVFEGYNRPGTDFASDTAWATWQHAHLTKAFSLLQKVRRS